MRRKASLGQQLSRLILFLLVIAVAAGAFFYVRNRQDLLAERFKQYLIQRLSQTFHLQVQIGSVEGDPRGTVSLRDVRVSVPRDSQELLDIFTCGEVRFRYTLLDFFRENFTSWFDVILEKPVFYANVPFSVPESPEARSVELFSAFAQKVRSSARLIIRDGTIAWIGKEGTLSGIDGIIANRSFGLAITLNHLKVGNFDATTSLQVDGRLVDGETPAHLPRLTGSIVTQGTVINWKPMPSESQVHFELTEDQLKVWDSHILGGIAMEGTVGHSNRHDIDLRLTIKDYPLQEMHDILSFSGSRAIGGRMNGKLTVQGAVTEPRLVGEFTIENNNAPDARFKALQLFFEGIFPQVKITRSQMILSNGNPMQFASDQEINIRELFSSNTYERLISRSEQRTVTWKNWTMYRERDKDTVLLEHPLDGGFTKGTSSDSEEGDDTLFGGKDSIKMELKDDEQMFTLQKKAQF